MAQPSPVQLLNFITDTFDLEELQTLCFQLYVPYDDLAGQTREGKARELIEFMQRVGRTDDLIATLAHERPIAWEKAFGTEQFVVARQAAAQPRPRDPRQVFVSHAHQDSKIAHRLAGDLRQLGFAVWIAPESIRPGERWVDAINRGLKESGIFLLVSTPSAVGSQWVQDETSYAIELAAKEKIRFIRLNVAEADVPPMWSVRQHISFRQSYDEGLAALRKALESAPAGSTQDAKTAASDKAMPESGSATSLEEAAITGMQAASVTQSAGADAENVTTLRLGAMLRQPKLLIGVVSLLALALLGLVAWNYGWLDNLQANVRPEATETEETVETDAGTHTSLPPAPSPTGESRTIILPSGIEVKQVEVPAGVFTMGIDGIGEYWNSAPAHEVELPTYWIDQTEVSVAQYESCVQEGTCDPVLSADLDPTELAEYPVVGVSWFDANRFCQWAGGRLPTEAEWENAAKGWETSSYPYGGTLPYEVANYDGAEGSLLPVGSLPQGASSVGAYDMLGNAWEWVADWYLDVYYVASPRQSPTGPSTGTAKVLRGGGFNADGSSTNSINRYFGEPTVRTEDFGFRCAADEISPAAAPVNNAPSTKILIPAGSFEMGSEDGDADEMPVHTISLDSYLIDRTEVTNAQFATFVEETGYETLGEVEGGGWSFDGTDWAYVEGADWRHPTGPESDIAELTDHPVVLVTWEDAVAYCRWAGGDLPTEAQWEYAARGPDGAVFPWGDDYDRENLNYCDQSCVSETADQDYDDGYAFSSPVGTYPDGASWVDAVDMMGNVWEWVRDWYGETYYARSPQEDPPGPDIGTMKIVRGGSWNDGVAGVATFDRVAYEPADRDFNLGFRCAYQD